MSRISTCSHCHLEFDKSIMIQDEDHYFCCSGCQGVFHLLHENGLESFYDKAGNTKLTPVKNERDDLIKFDTESFYDKYVKVNSDQFCEISLIIEGIHCSACVWLNEKVLQKMDGVVDANINFTNNKAHVIWKDDVVKLSSIIEMIRSIGYNAFAYDRSLQETRANAKRKEYFLKIAVAVFASMNIMMIAIAQYAGYFTGMAQSIKTTLNIAEWVLATPVLFYSGWIFFRGAYFGLKNNIVNMDILVATGALLTYIYSIYITVFEYGEAYFDSVSMIITFVLIGKYLEIMSKKNAIDALDIMGQHIPTELKIIRGQTSEYCKLDDVKKNDVVVLSSGERVFVDGKVIKGEGNFNESSLTGESKPVFKALGDSVISGSVSIDADVFMKVTKPFAHSTLSSLVALLDKAMTKKPPIEQLANKLSEYFSSTILLFSLLTFLAWWYWPHSFEESFLVGISVIVIACPCALALATPVATLVGLNIGSRRGILFKEAAQLEMMAKADVVVFDKTGTLTVGKPQVVQEHILIEFDKSLLYSLLHNSKHPVSQAIEEFLGGDIREYVLQDYKQRSGYGIEAKYNDFKIIGGNKKLMQEYQLQIEFESLHSVFYFAINEQIVAIYELSDTIKENAKVVINNFFQRGLEVIMLTGDEKVSAYNIANELEIKHVLYAQSPQDKYYFIKKLHNEGKKVIMVGDGVNDILALASSDIGIVMGSGSDIAIDVGDVVLLNDSLESLQEAIQISKTTYTLIKQNLLLSLVYNAITIPLAMAGLIIPFIAAIAMSTSSLLVVGNSMRIRLAWSKK